MIHISNDIALDFDDVLIEPKPTSISSRKEVNLNVTYNTLNSKKFISGVPIMSANMSSVSTFDMADAFAEHGMFCCLHKHYSIDEYNNFYNNRPKSVTRKTFFTIGMNDTDILYNLDNVPELICIDVANGYMETFLDHVSKIRQYAPESIIMAGNVVTAEGAINLLEVGADIIKVGIGSGSVCHTRVVAGVGVPQLTAILNTIDAVQEKGGLICSDGGITKAGDFSKAYVAGANFVMSGGMFSGHDECNMMRITDETGNTFVEYYGMSSEHAMNKHNGGMSKYRASEGKMVRIKYKGSVHNTIEHILGGIRSAGSYISCKELQYFSKHGKLIKVRSTHNKIFGE